MTVRKWEWLTFMLLLGGIGMGVHLLVRLTATDLGSAHWPLWVGVAGQGLAAIVCIANGLRWTPLTVTIDDTGITSRRGPRHRFAAWADLENLWVAKRGQAVSLISTSAPKPSFAHPWDWIQARRLGVAPDALLGSIRPDMLAAVESGVRCHGRRELPVVYAH